MFLEHSWWSIVGAESGPSDWRLLKGHQRAVLCLCLHLSLLYLSSLLWTKDLGGAQTLSMGLRLSAWGSLPPRVGSVSLWFLGADPRLLAL